MALKLFLLSIFFVGAVQSASAAPGPADVDREAHKVFGAFLSPFCPGRLLSDCPSSAAGELREKIRARVEKGESGEQVLESLFDDYGDRFRAAPQARGFGTVAWVAPGLFLLIGIVTMSLWLRSRMGASTPEVAAVLSAEDQARVEREMRGER